MSALFLSRISLRAEPSVATLAPILFDTAGRHRCEASRRLVWTLFADREDRTRDFLWREGDARRFYVLSNRPPEDRHQLFTVETKAFEPAGLNAKFPGSREFSIRLDAAATKPLGSREFRLRRRDGRKSLTRQSPFPAYCSAHGCSLTTAWVRSNETTYMISHCNNDVLSRTPVLSESGEI
jgi:hypothetical protein